MYIDSRESDDIDLASFLVAYFPSACVDTQINVAVKRIAETLLETRKKKSNCNSVI